MEFKKIYPFIFFAVCYWSTYAATIWTPEKIVSVKQISSVQLSPDHQFAVCVVTEPHPNKDAFLSRIYISSIQDPTKICLLCSPELSTSQPQWSPDGQWISFLSDQSGTNNL